jgi:hypothetical protein
MFYINENDNNILINQEQDIAKVTRSAETTNQYTTFDENLLKSLTKFTKPALKSQLEQLIKDRKIFFGITKQSFPATFGTYRLHQDYLESIILDSHLLDIDLKTGDSIKPNNLLYATYYTLIRVIVKTFFDDIKKNETLINMLLTYYQFLFIKQFKFIGLIDKKKRIFDILVGVFVYRFIIGYNSVGALNRVFDNLKMSPDEEKELRTFFDNSMIDKYTKFNEIFRSFNDFKITTETPMDLAMTLMMKIKNQHIYQ